METLQRTANRGSISTGYDIDNSLKFETDNSEYMYFDGSSVTDYERTTFSVWVKRTELGIVHYIAEFGNGTANTTNLRIFFDTDNTLRIYGNSIIYRITNRVFRDTSAWYHLFFKFDTTQGFSNDRVRLWVNGVQETSFSTINNPGSGTSMGFNRNLRNTLGAGSEDGPRGFFAGYIAQAWNSGGTPPDVTDFGEFDADTGIWKPIDISELSIPDSNGFYLDFYNSADLGNDSSSNNNDFTLNNITSVDQATDTPTNNFATYNALVNTNATYGTTGSFKITNGATSFDQSDANIFSSNISTLGVKNGKWYAEFSGAFSNNSFVGIVVQENTHFYANSYFGLRTDAEQPGIGYYADNGRIYKNATNVAYGNSFTNSDIISVALDMDNQYVYFAKNGVWQNSGDPTSGSSGTGGIALATDDRGTLQFYGIGATIYSNDGAVTCNFGGFPGFTISSGNADANGYGNFEYAPPSGYYAMCTKNLAEYG